MNGTERNGTDNEGKEGGVSSRGTKRFPPEPPFQKEWVEWFSNLGSISLVC